MNVIFEESALSHTPKKDYCHCCGQIIHKQRIEKVIRKNDSEFLLYKNKTEKFKMDEDIVIIGMHYYCEKCDKFFSYDEQNKIRLAQKYYKRKIVKYEDVCKVPNEIEKPIDKLKHLKRYLWIPIIGVAICLNKIFHEKQNNKSRINNRLEKAEGNIILLSALIMIAYYFIMQMIFNRLMQMSEYFYFLDKWGIVIIFYTAIFIFNLPTLFYIQKKINKEKQLKNN